MGGASPERWAADVERRWLRRGTGSVYRKLQSIQFLLTRDRRAVTAFLRARYPIALSIASRIRLIRDFTRITNAVRGYHTLAEMLIVCDRIFRRAGRPGLTVVEAGAGSGSSTAKLSLATRIAGGRLVVFDSFRGIPENDEKHRLLDGRNLEFRKGAFRGRFASVRKRIERFGAIEVCEFRKGLFADTLPRFADSVDVVLLDVDLVASTRICTAHLFPKLRRGGVLLSQDGHLQATVDLFRDPEFWRSIGSDVPSIPGLGREKLLEIGA